MAVLIRPTVREIVSTFGIERFTVPQVSGRCGLDAMRVEAALRDLVEADAVTQVTPDLWINTRRPAVEVDQSRPGRISLARPPMGGCSDTQGERDLTAGGDGILHGRYVRPRSLPRRPSEQTVRARSRAPLSSDGRA
jgi:hypothetical protein